jgi:hypothetical protein
MSLFENLNLFGTTIDKNKYEFEKDKYIETLGYIRENDRRRDGITYYKVKLSNDKYELFKLGTPKPKPNVDDLSDHYSNGTANAVDMVYVPKKYATLERYTDTNVNGFKLVDDDAKNNKETIYYKQITLGNDKFWKKLGKYVSHINEQVNGSQTTPAQNTYENGNVLLNEALYTKTPTVGGKRSVKKTRRAKKSRSSTRKRRVFKK